MVNKWINIEGIIDRNNSKNGVDSLNVIKQVLPVFGYKYKCRADGVHEFSTTEIGITPKLELYYRDKDGSLMCRYGMAGAKIEQKFECTVKSPSYCTEPASASLVDTLLRVVDGGKYVDIGCFKEYLEQKGFKENESEHIEKYFDGCKITVIASGTLVLVYIAVYGERHHISKTRNLCVRCTEFGIEEAKNIIEYYSKRNRLAEVLR